MWGNWITHILNLSCRRVPRTAYWTRNKLIGLDDEPEEDLGPALEPAFAFLDEVRRVGGRCLAHCRKGRSRSVSVVLSYLVMKMGYTLDEAWKLVVRRRPVANPNSGFAEQLFRMELRVGRESYRFRHAIAKLQACHPSSADFDEVFKRDLEWRRWGRWGRIYADNSWQRR